MRFLTAAIVFLCVFLFPLSGAEKLVFSCDFSKGAEPQVSVQPCRYDLSNVSFVDAGGKKVLRVGKKAGKKAGRVCYSFGPQVEPQKLANNMHPFPMRFGKMQFRFRAVGWKPQESSGHNILLRIEGPRGTLLHLTFINPHGVPSVQLAYGQQKNPNVGKGELSVIYPYIDLNARQEWHDVTVIWEPSTVTLKVDGYMAQMTTRTLAYPEKDFYAERMYLGYGLSKLSHGETDIADLKIWATEPDWAAERKKNRYPLLTVNPMREPVIDGNVSDQEWSNASAYSGFLKLPKCNLSEYQPEVRAGFDQKNLYFSIVSKGHKRPPLCRENAPDGRVWKDDSIELYLASPADKGNYYHIVLNRAGTVFDRYCQEGKTQSQQTAWNCKNFRSATKVSGSEWRTEIAVPFASLGMKTPAKGEVLYFNFCENIIGSGYYSLSSVKNRFAEYDKFGVLEFGDSTSPVINFSQLGDLFRGEAAFRCSVSGKEAAQLEISAKRYDQTADTEFALFSETVPVSSKSAICFKAGADRLKKNGILYAALRQKGNVIYSGRFFYESAMAAEIENMRREVRNGRNHLRIVTSQMNDGKSRLRLLISDQTGRLRAEQTVPVTGMKQTTFFDISQLPEGSYTLSGELLDSAGSVSKNIAGREFVVYGKVPPWQGFVKNNFKLDHVPAPWTPLEVRKSGKRFIVSCWNRVYTFGPKSLFAEKITTSGISLLKDPVRLLLKKDGTQVEITETEQKIISSTARKVVLESRGRLSGGGAVTVRAEIEYDGFIWYEMKLDVPAGSSLERLAVQFDMVKKYSTLLNSGFRDLGNTGSTPAYWNKSLEGISGPFWVGMEKGGLSFGIESTENWSNKKLNTQAELFRKQGATNIFLNIADLPFKIRKAPVYGFYVHPTPVRPRPAGYRQLRAHDWFSHNRAAARPQGGYPANFSWWTTSWYYQGYPDWAVDQKDMAKVYSRLPKEYARNGKFFNFDKLDKKRTRTAWYAAYSSVGRNAPEVIWNGDSWFSGARERLYGNTLYGYEMDMIEVCKTADYCDFYLWRFDQAKKAKPVIDGLYFDLWGPSACDRKDHNHGYTDASGVRKSVFPLREHRRWLELIYLYCKEKANKAPIVCHVSGATAHIAGYSYADYLLDGELWFDKLAQDRFYKAMTLDKARAEILPHIWGPGMLWLSELHRARGYVPASQQKTWRLAPWADRHLAGILLLHDVIPDRTSLFETAREIWTALDKFKLSDKDIYLPYWKKFGVAGHNDGKKIAVTAYLKHNRKKLLLIVFNNMDHNWMANLKIDVKKIFGSDGKLKIIDLESGRKRFSGVTQFTILVPQRNFRLLQATLEK